MNFENLKNSIDTALKELSVSEYEIYYMSSTDTTVETLNREISSFTSGVHGGLCLRVVVDGKLGYASTELMDESEMTDLAYRALMNAKYVEKEDTVGIFAGSPSYEESRIPEYQPITAGNLKEYAMTVADKLYAKSDKVTDGTSSQTVSAGFNIRIVNSHGLDLSVNCGANIAVGYAIISDNGEMQSSFALGELSAEKIDECADKVADESVSDALSKVGADLVPSGKYNIVIDGKEMRSILSVFSSAFSARQVLDGISMLKDKVGKSIASPIVNITDDPQREGNSVGLTFDAEGVATHRRDVIKDGVLMTYLHNRETAMAMNTESTANASKADYSSPVSIRPHSFCIEAGDKTFDELLSLAGNGIFITELKGLHAGANPVTGDFSLESAGFLIEDGKLGRAVKSFTVAGNFFTLLGDIAALGDKIERGVATGFTSFGSPHVLVENMSVAGK